MHQCNWKMFVENLNDTMHPMVVHESSAGTAKRMWIDKPADAPKPMAIEQFAPFMSDYKFFEDMGVRVFDNGHSFSGVHFSIHSKYSAIPAYDAAMKAAYGDERTAQILGLARHNTVYYPNLTIKGAIQSIRVVKPIAVDKTLVESWTFRLVGAPPELLQRTTMYNRLINSPFSVVGHDDLQAYRGIQAGLHASGNPWISLHRNYDPNEVGPEGRDGDRHQRDLDAQPVPRVGAVHDADDVTGRRRDAHEPVDADRERLIDFVVREARLLDEKRYEEWNALFTDDALLLGAAGARPGRRPEPHLAPVRGQAAARAAHRAAEEPARVLAAAADAQPPPAADADGRARRPGGERIRRAQRVPLHRVAGRRAELLRRHLLAPPDRRGRRAAHDAEARRT